MIKLRINWGLSSTIDLHDCDWLNQRKQRGPGRSKNLPLKFSLGWSGPRSIVCGSPHSRHRITRCSTRVRRQKERTSSLPNNPFSRRRERSRCRKQTRREERSPRSQVKGEMVNLRSDSPTCRRIVLAFLDFLQSGPSSLPLLPFPFHLISYPRSNVVLKPDG